MSVLKNLVHLSIAIGIAGWAASVSAADVPTVVLDRSQSRSVAIERCSKANEFFTQNQNQIKKTGCGKIEGCSKLKPTFDACVAGPTGGVVEFEDKLVAQFNTEKTCKGARLISTASPDAVSSPHWTMSIDYVPGAPKQAWKLQAEGSQSLITDNGGPKEIAVQLCFILVDRGVRRKAPD